MEFEQITFTRFDGELCKGTIGEHQLGQYVFTHVAGLRMGDKLRTTHEGIKEALNRLKDYRMYRDKDKLNLFGGFVSVHPDKADALERELNLLVQAWHQK